MAFLCKHEILKIHINMWYAPFKIWNVMTKDKWFSSWLQWDDKYHTKRYNQHSAVPEHGEVLERTTCDLCHAETCGGAYPQCPVQETSNHCGHLQSALGPSQKGAQSCQESLEKLTTVAISLYSNFIKIHPNNHVVLYRCTYSVS